MAFDWKNLLKGAAPMLATALGGPLAGGAAALLVKALGKEGEVDPKDPQAVGDLLAEAAMKPELIAQVKLAELEFQKAMMELSIKSVSDLERIAADDRNSARNREIQVKDKTPAIGFYLITAGFFGLIVFLLLRPIPDSNKASVYTMLGSLGTAWICAVQYYYGTNRTSGIKDQLLYNSKPGESR